MKEKQILLQLKILGYNTKKYKDSIKQFQKDNNLIIDGSFGPKSINKSLKIIKKYQKNINSIINSSLIINGYAGKETEKQLKSFQRLYKLKQTGTFNKDTIEKMELLLGKADYDKFQNFVKKEFKCPKYCNGFPTDMQHLTVLIAQRCRTHFKNKCTISSGIRCEKYNNTLDNSIKDSKHLYGKAIDLKIENIKGKSLLKYLKKQKEVKYAYIIKDNWVHFNIN